MRAWISSQATPPAAAPTSRSTPIFCATIRNTPRAPRPLPPSAETSPNWLPNSASHRRPIPFASRSPITTPAICSTRKASAPSPGSCSSAIPGLEWTELPESATCCGSAGIFNLIEPETARQLADRKAQHVIGSGAQALVSANPGCLLHIASGLRRAGHPLPVFHIVELIDAALGPSSLELR